MFKRIDLSKGSPICMIEATIYMFGKDYDLYKEWSSKNTSASIIKDRLVSIKTSLLGSGIILSFEAEPIKVADACGVLDRSRRSDQPNVKMMDLGLSQTMYFLAVTESGMPITTAEKEELLKCAMLTFTDVAVENGALYMIVDIDGEKTCWHNDDSYYQYSLNVGNRNNLSSKIPEEEQAEILSALEELFNSLAKVW